MTLEELLRSKVSLNMPAPLSGAKEVTPDFLVAVQDQTPEGVHIIIHPDGYNGDTLDFLVSGNTLKEL